MPTVGHGKGRPHIARKGHDQVGEVRTLSPALREKLEPDQVWCPVCSWPATRQPGVLFQHRYVHDCRLWACGSDIRAMTPDEELDALASWAGVSW